MGCNFSRAALAVEATPSARFSQRDPTTVNIAMLSTEPDQCHSPYPGSASTATARNNKLPQSLSEGVTSLSMETARLTSPTAQEIISSNPSHDARHGRLSPLSEEAALACSVTIRDATPTPPALSPNANGIRIQAFEGKSDGLSRWPATSPRVPGIMALYVAHSPTSHPFASISPVAQPSSNTRTSLRYLEPTSLHVQPDPDRPPGIGDRFGASVTPIILTSSVELTKTVEASGSKRKHVNQYLLGPVLGRGSYGKVRQCESVITNEQRAMKIFHKGALQRKRIGRFGNALQSVQSEVVIWSKLRHGNIVQLHEVIDDPSCDKMFLISELMEGGSVLPDALQAEPVPIWIVKVVMKQVIQAVHHLHSCGFAHRDIKPCNILWNRSRDVAKLSDFGVALEWTRREDGTLDDTSRSTTGTPAFTAPEMLLPAPFSTRSQDVWAVGVCMYTMLFGRPPWMADSLPALYDLIKEGRVLIPSHPGTPDWIQAVDLITRVLDANPKTRISLDAAASHPLFAPLSISTSTMVPKRTLPPFSPPQRSSSSHALSPGASSLDVHKPAYGDGPMNIKSEEASLYLSSTSEFDASMSGIIVARPQSAVSTDSNLLGVTLVPES